MKKIKKIVIMSCVLIITQNLVAQVRNIYAALDSCFMNLNLSACSTHVLINKGFPTSNPSFFTGNISTCQPAKPKDWIDMYSSMYYGKTAASTWTMPNPTQLATNMYSTESSLQARLIQVNTEMGEVAKLPLLYADYNYIITNMTSTPFYTQNSQQQLFDNTNRTANPYGQNLLVSTASILTESKTGSVLFMVPTNLYLSNKTSITNLSLSADFNGTGSYVALSPDVPYLHKYTSTGIKTITLKIVHGSNTYYAKTTIDVKQVSSTISSIWDPTLGEFTFQRVWRDRVSQTTGTDLSNAIGTIVLSNNNTTTETGSLKLRNPVIFIEGQDILNEFRFVELYDLINRGRVRADGLIEKLYNDDRDLIILDFGDMHTKNLRELSEVVRRLINYVNQNLDPAVSNNKVTLAGHSMGGVLARYTLAKMEQTYCENHNVSLYVSYDAPHKGANVALGFQELTYQGWAAGSFFIDNSTLGAYLQLIAPTTKELANAYFSVSNSV